VATVLGFIVGCALHALPWTAGFLYNDVIAMNVSAICAAVFTFIWAWKDFQMPFTKADSADGIGGDDSLCKQRLLTADKDSSEASEPSTSWRVVGAGAKVVAGDYSSIAKSVSDILQRASGGALVVQSTITWSTEVLQTTINLWNNQKASVSLVGREAFARAGLQDCCSISRVDAAGRLHITIGLFGETELRLPSWKALQGRM